MQNTGKPSRNPPVKHIQYVRSKKNGNLKPIKHY
jgi:hypothetical protein